MHKVKINKCFESVMFDPNSDASREAIGRAIIAAHTAKLLAGVEMPERYDCVRDIERNVTEDVFTLDQLQAYAAAAALNARREALEEAKQACMKGEYAIDGGGNAYYRPADATFCIASIEKLKGKV